VTSQITITPTAVLVERATEAAFNVAADTADCGRGLCLITSAILGRALVDGGTEDVSVAVGTSAGEPHWWLTWGDRIIDATRMQFDDGDLISDDHDLYRPARSFPVGWSDDQLIEEAQRVFFYADAAQQFVSRMRREIADSIAASG
jgi:hypothetical protein